MSADHDQYLNIRQPTDDRKPVKPSPPRWVPSDDPDSIAIPGLDTTAPANDQIDYIEQLITVKLQNVDENMAKIHHLLTTRMLPAFKKYAVGTEPVREAAKFWLNFFEKAARVRLPIYDEFSTAQEQDVQHEQESQPTETDTEAESHPEDHDVTAQPTAFDPNRTPSESSFMPGQGAISSTPAAFSRHRSTNETHESFASHTSEDAPWARSLESPLVRLDRELQSLSHDDHDHDPPQEPPLGGEPSVYLEPSVHNDKGKSKEITQPLLHDVLRSKLFDQNEIKSANPPLSRSNHTSPLKFRRRPGTPKALNPFLPPETKPEHWNGIVDLKKTPLTTPLPQGYSGGYSSSFASGGPSAAPKTPEDDDDDDDLYPPGMSPLTTIQLPTMVRPTLGRSPSKEAAKRIGKDLVSDAQRRGGKGTAESSLSSMPTPPSLQRYTRSNYAAPGTDVSSSGVDTSIESLMRRVGLNVSKYQEVQSITPAPSSLLEVARAPVFTSQHLQQEEEPPEEPHTPEPAPYIPEDDTVMQGQVYQDDDDSFDSFDEPINDTQNPSHAFQMLLASNQRDPNDSFDSFDDSFGGGDLGPPVVPFADDGDDWDDSFDQDEPTETLFGAHRLQAQAQGEDEGVDGELLRGKGWVEKTIGIGNQLARVGRVNQTPTQGPSVEDASMLA